MESCHTVLHGRRSCPSFDSASTKEPGSGTSLRSCNRAPLSEISRTKHSVIDSPSGVVTVPRTKVLRRAVFRPESIILCSQGNHASVAEIISGNPLQVIFR